MAAFREYAEFDGLGLADLVRKGDVTPGELFVAAMETLEQTNPSINAIAFTMEAEAERSLATLPSATFSGVPFLAKDLVAFLRRHPDEFGQQTDAGPNAALRQ